LSNIFLGIIAGGLALAGLLIITIWIRDETRKISYLRTFVQVASLIGIFYLFSLTLWLSVVLIVIFAATVFLGRFFCGWICPFGLYMDFISQVRKTLRIGYWNLPEWLNKNLHRLRYMILLVSLVPPILLFFLDPLYQQKWASALFLIGSFQPLTILLAPLEPIIVPWGETLGFSGLSLSYPYIRQVTIYSSGIFITINVILFIVLTVASSFLVRRFWCRFCPTGISIGIVNHVPHFKWAPIMHLNKVEEKCTKCGICKRVCPLQVTEVYDQKGGDIATSMCMLCLRCVEMCPYEGCLKANFNGKTFFKSRNWLKK